MNLADFLTGSMPWPWWHDKRRRYKETHPDIDDINDAMDLLKLGYPPPAAQILYRAPRPMVVTVETAWNLAAGYFLRGGSLRTGVFAVNAGGVEDHLYPIYEPSGGVPGLLWSLLENNQDVKQLLYSPAEVTSSIALDDGTVWRYDDDMPTANGFGFLKLFTADPVMGINTITEMRLQRLIWYCLQQLAADLRINALGQTRKRKRAVLVDSQGNTLDSNRVVRS